MKDKQHLTKSNDIENDYIEKAGETKEGGEDEGIKDDPQNQVTDDNLAENNNNI